MKKILCLCLTFLITVCCFNFVGCESDGIEYIAKMPEIQYRSEIYEYGNGTDESVQLTLNGCAPISQFKFYNNFSKYYFENLKGSNSYLLYRSNEKSTLNPYDEGNFGFYRERETGDLILQEAFDYYNKELGTKSDDGKDGVKSVSIYLNIFIKPIEKTDDSEIILEFGKLESSFYRCDKYINIYLGEKCFATCYYESKVTIRREWYENYLKTNLIYGDEL